MINQTLDLAGGATLTTYVQDSEVGFGRFVNRPAMLICPGGAFLIHATRECEAVAIEFMRRGFQCFVVRYSVATNRECPERQPEKAAPYPTQLMQLMEAMHVVTSNAEAWHVDESRMYVMGFSAGGHVAASLGVRWNDPSLTEKLPFEPVGDELRPSGVILGYPMLRFNDGPFAQGLSDEAREQGREVYRFTLGTASPSPSQLESMDLIPLVGPESAPVFVWNCADDSVIDCTAAFDFMRALLAADVSCEYHLFSRGGHGQPLFNGLTMDEDSALDGSLSSWVDLAIAWIDSLKSEVLLPDV